MEKEAAGQEAGLTPLSTPGPWFTYDDSGSATHRHEIVAAGKTIAHIYCTRGHEVADRANAQLIAAAPDLLAALETANVEMAALLDFPDRATAGDWPLTLGEADVECLHKAFTTIRAAISKARGQ